MTILLIDGDQYLFKACAACEYEARWDDHNSILTVNKEEAWDVFVGSVDKVKDKIGFDKAYLAFTGNGNFRNALDPNYKSSRGRKPLGYNDLVQRAHDTFKAHQVDGLEADDLLGIWATSGKFGPTIIVSDDKDMQTLPAQVWREGQVNVYTTHQANAFWLWQTLTGDPTDGYKGCPGIGKVKADRLLAEFWHDEEFDLPMAWAAVVDEYVKAGLTGEDALTQARCARILRASDWDSTNKEPILWQPQTP